MDEDDDEPVPLPNVNAAILKKVHPFCYFAKLTNIAIYEAFGLLSMYWWEVWWLDG